MLILADTSCWVEYLRPSGDGPTRDQMLAWLRADRLALCGAVRAEVLRGVRSGEAAGVDRALSGLAYLPSVDEDWLTVTGTGRALAAAGVTVPLLDLLIAALAVRVDALLAHRDAHFQAIAAHLPLRVHSFLPSR